MTLLIRAPDEHKNAEIFIDGKNLGKMGGKQKSFKVEPNKKLTVQLKEYPSQSEIKTLKFYLEKVKKLFLILSNQISTTKGQCAS